MEQIGFFEKIGCKEPPEPKPKKKSRLIPEDLRTAQRSILRRGRLRSAAGKG